MIKHDKNREREVQLLCKEFLERKYPKIDYKAGLYCPFCYSGKVRDGVPRRPVPFMKDIIHHTDCPWLIAKDLYTGEKEK